MTIKTLTLGMTLAFLSGVVGSSVLAQRATPASQSGAQAIKAAPAPEKPAEPQRTRKPWWSDDATKKELGLTADQVKTLDQIFTSTKDELAGYSEALLRETKELERLIDESKVERWVVARQIDKEETARSNFNKLRLMTNYRMHQVLTADQRVKLLQIRDRDHKDPRRRP